MEKLTASFGFKGADGVSPTIETSKTDGVTTLTITDVEGTKTATILDGEEGKVRDGVPTNSVIGFDGTSSNIPAGYELTDETFGGGGETLKIGTILPFSGTTLPAGYLFCDGAEISRTTYSDLFVVIGTKYGEGNGTTTFNLPNLSGKVPLGLDSNDNDFNVLGNTGGEKTHKLTVAEMPKHKHDTQINRDSGSMSWGGLTGVQNVSGVTYGYADSTQVGGDTAHNNLQPYMVVNYIIKATQTAPINGQVIDSYTESQTDSYSAHYLNGKLGEIFNRVHYAAFSKTISDSFTSSYKDVIWQSVEGDTNDIVLGSNNYDITINCDCKYALMLLSMNTTSDTGFWWKTFKNGNEFTTQWESANGSFHNDTCIMPVQKNDVIKNQFYMSPNSSTSNGNMNKLIIILFN